MIMKKKLSSLTVKIFSLSTFLLLGCAHTSPYDDDAPLYSHHAIVEHNNISLAPQLEDIATAPLTCKKCIEIALHHNRQKKASQYALELAEAQHQQALSAYWPHFDLNGLYAHFDQAPLFVAPPSTVLGIPVEKKEIPLMDKDLGSVMVSGTYLLYDGGWRDALRRKAEKGIAIAQNESQRTTLQITYDVDRMYHGCILAHSLYNIGKDTLDRMDITTQLTMSLYENGSGKVKRTDFLRTKTITEGLRALVARLHHNIDLAHAALATTMGLPWDTSFDIADAAMPFMPYDGDLYSLIETAYSFSPDWKKMSLSLAALQAHLDEEKSGHHPKLAATAGYNQIFNSFDYGLVSSTNKKTWQCGIVLTFPLFDGFLTKNKVKAMQSKILQFEQEQYRLHEGIALRIKDVFLSISSAQDREAALKESLSTAIENRSLCDRAYRESLIETKEMVETILLEAFIHACYYKALYDHVESRSHLNLIVGTDVESIMQ
jgi:outer membrane protein